MSLSQSFAAPFAADAETRSARRALAAAGAIAALGVFLVFGHKLGLGAALFAGAVEIAAIIAARASRRASMACAAVGAAALAPLCEDASSLSVAIAACGAAAVALIANGEGRGDFARLCLRGTAFLGFAPFNVLFDLPGVAARAARGGIGARALIGWILPLGLGGVFLALFTAANPIIEDWLSRLDFASAPPVWDARRIALWFLLFVVVWPFVRFRWPENKDAPASAAADGAGSRLLSSIFTEAATLRSLVLFNAMFAVQTALDGAILWGGRGLPAGLSFASYAHRGAYPLVITALLAGAFVMLAMREAAGARPRIIRALVHLWIAQNVALVVSSLYRLDLYVRVYSLTYWRVAAFVWMALVAAGLLLIFTQICARRSSRWLLSVNLATGAAALYCVSFANLDYLIADFNLRHCYEAAGDGVRLDTAYLGSLGPEALPALDRTLSGPGPLSTDKRLIDLRAELERQRRDADGDWRAFSFRAWRLARRLQADASP